MLIRKVISTFGLSVIFWLTAGWAVAWGDNAKTRGEYADAALVAALLLVVLGLFLRKIGSMAKNDHEATKGTKGFALIILVTGIACSLVALRFRL